MKLIVGLGNPGLEYAKTRHNAGFMAADRLAERHARGQIAKSKFHASILDATIADEKCLLMKPTTYMNRSGQAIAEAVRFYKLTPASDLLVLVDDAAIDVGTVRVRASGGAGGQNGLADIQQKLGTADYPRLRIGIGPRPSFMTLHDFVLGRFSEDDAGPLDTALTKAADAAELFVAQGVDTAMNRFNTRPPKPPKPEPATQPSDETVVPPKPQPTHEQIHKNEHDQGESA